MREEVWRTVEEFQGYEVSNMGRIINTRTGQEMRVSYTNHGHPKITLLSDWNNQRFTRSVALLVAEAFLEKPNFMCDQVIFLDGDFTNFKAENLSWRPRWFAWKYARQLKVEQPMHYLNLKVANVTFGLEYRCIVDAGMVEGLLFDDIWKSTFSSEPTYPYGSIFEITERV